MEISHHSNVMVGVRIDQFANCKPDDEDLCICSPYEYKPESYDAGEMCERCWMTNSRIIGELRCGHYYFSE